jgi:hypothetical protein
MTGKSKATTDHEIIYKWAEVREGIPAVLSAAGNEFPSLLITFPSTTLDMPLRTIPWNEFFSLLESYGLAMVYEDETEEGDISLFNRFVDRESVEEYLAEDLDVNINLDSEDEYLDDLDEIEPAEEDY